MYEYIMTWVELKTDKRAVTALEYGLIAAAVVIVGLAAFGTIGTNLNAKFLKIQTALS